MSILSNRFENAAAEAEEYVALLRNALGVRDPMEELESMPEALGRAVAGLTADQQATPEAPGKWSIRQVVQHLADSELVGGFRFRMVLAHDAPLLPGYDQDLWAERLRYQDADLATALNDFTVVRRSNVRHLRRATPEDLRRVMRHTERGDEALGQMVWMYAGHDLVHLAQIARIRKAIGAGETAL